MPTILSAIAAIFLIICLGHLMRRARFVDDLFWPQLDRVNYYVLMPALLLNSIAIADLSDVNLLPFICALMTAIAAMMILVIAARPILGLEGPQFASFFQACTRWNGFVALATIVAVYGAPALGPAGVAFAVLVPFLNVMSVIVLARNAHSQPPGPKKILGLLVRNPLVWACFVASLLNASGIGLPGPVGDFMLIVSRAALAMGLVSVGAALNLGALRAVSFHLGLASGLKLLLMPLLMFASATLFGIDGLALSVMIVAGSVPTATASYVLARQLGGDAEFMASLITATTLISVVTMPLILALLGS